MPLFKVISSQAKQLLISTAHSWFWPAGNSKSWYGIQMPSVLTIPLWDDKMILAFGLSKNDGDGECSFLSAYREASGSSPWAWSKGRWPSGAVLHPSCEPGVWRP